MVDHKVQRDMKTLVRDNAGPLVADLDGTLSPETIRPLSNSGYGSAIDRFGRFSFTTSFVLAAALVVGSAIAGLGYWTNRRIENIQLENAARSGALHVEGFLAPLARSIDLAGDLSVSSTRELDDLLARASLVEQFIELRIWRADGTIVYSTNKSLVGKRMQSSHLEEAFAGGVLAELEYVNDDDLGDIQPQPYPLLEIYAPIHAPGTNDVIAVGELYQNANAFLSQRAEIRVAIAQIFSLTTIHIVALLFLVASQRAKLRNQLVDARALALQNTQLRTAADKARLDANKSNEHLLNQIGADLHDGPVQLLSLLILRLTDKKTKKRSSSKEDELQTSAAIATNVLAELRELSTGLVLPEIKQLSLEEALRLAVRRHENFTGTHVDVKFISLPETVSYPLKICLYRIIQEALNNAHRHANAQGQGVIVERKNQFLTIRVIDDGPGLKIGSVEPERQRLGLHGIRNRVETFGGILEVHSRSEGGTEVTARIPLDGNAD